MSVLDRVSTHIESDERYERTTLASDYRPGEQDEEDQRVDRVWTSVGDYALIEVQSESERRMAFLRVSEAVIGVCVPVREYRCAYYLDSDQTVTAVVEELRDEFGASRVDLIGGRGRVARRLVELFTDDGDDDDGE